MTVVAVKIHILTETGMLLFGLANIRYQNNGSVF
jgi:hypothetical protein